MQLLHKIDDGFAWLSSNGTYSQRSLYKRGEQLFVAYGSGFLLICKNGSGYGTSAPKVSCIELDVGELHTVETFEGYKVRVRQTGVKA